MKKKTKELITKYSVWCFAGIGPLIMVFIFMLGIHNYKAKPKEVYICSYQGEESFSKLELFKGMLQTPGGQAGLIRNDDHIIIAQGYCHTSEPCTKIIMLDKITGKSVVYRLLLDEKRTYPGSCIKY